MHDAARTYKIDVARGNDLTQGREISLLLPSITLTGVFSHCKMLKTSSRGSL